MKRIAPILLLLALGATCWLLLASPRNDQASAPTDSLDDQHVNEPELRGRSADQGAEDAQLPHGSGTIAGRVVLSGRHIPATVELRYVRDVPPTGAFTANVVNPAPASWVQRAMRASEPLRVEHAPADGSFEFVGLPTGAYEVHAITASGRQGIAQAIVATDESRVDVTVHMPHGDGIVRGRARRPSGSPVDGWAILRLAEWSYGGRWWRSYGQAWEVPLDAEGRFSFHGLPDGQAVVWIINGENGVTRSAGVKIQDAQHLDLIIGGERVVVNGRILDAETGRGIGNARVEGASRPGDGTIVVQETTSNAQGRFALQLSAGRGGLRVSAPGYRSHVARQLRFPLQETPIQLMLGSTHGLSGTIVDQKGLPVSDVQVWTASFYRYGGLEALRGTHADDQGQFRFTQIGEDEVTLFALSSSWCSEGLASADPGGSNPLSFRAGGKESTRIMTVVPTATVEGHVRTPEGDPVVGGTLIAEASTSFLAELKGVWTTTSDENGAYLLPGIVPDVEYRVRVRAPGRGEHRTRPFRLGSGDRMQLDVLSPAPRYIEIRVRTQADRAAVAGATVHAETLDDPENDWPDEERPARVWMTDKEGVARIGPLGRGSIGIRVRAKGLAHFPADPRFYVLPGSDSWESGHAFELELPPGLSLRGRVALPDDMPASEVYLSIGAEAGGRFSDNELLRRMSVSYPRLKLDPDGSFQAEGLLAGAYSISARARWRGFKYEDELSAEAGIHDVELALERGEALHVLKVRVRDAAGERPTGGRVALFSFSDGSRSGSYEDLERGDADIDLFGPLEVGASYWIYVHDVADPPIRGHAVGPITTAEEPVEVRLDAPKTISGRVSDPGGAPVAAARVEARPRLGRPVAVDAEYLSTARSWAVTRDDGSFALEGLGPGEYFVAVVPPGTHQPPHHIVAEAGATGLVIEVAAAPRPLTIKVLDSDGAPVGAALIRGLPQDPDREMASFRRRPPPRTNEEGVLTVHGLRPDTALSLSIVPPERLRGVLRPANYTGPAGDVTVRLVRDRPVRGVVRVRGGAAAREAVVYYAPEGAQKARWVRTQERGAFSILNLDAGEILVWARPPRDEMRDGGWWVGPPPEDARQVQTGTDDVTIALP